MNGDPDDNMQKGIMPRAFEDIIQILDGDYKVTIKASYLEIYNEEIRDLLSNNPKQRLILHEKPDTGVYVDKLSWHPIESIDALYYLLKEGSVNRSVGATNMNDVSSRSHSLF
jgi:kinesin family member 3B